MCDKSAFRKVPDGKTAEQMYREWWEKEQEKKDDNKET
jgi:hypothetical protein